MLRSALFASTLCVAVLAGRSGLTQARTPRSPISAARVAFQTTVSSSHSVYLGVSVHQWGTQDLLNNLAQYQADAGRKAAIVVYWRDFANSGSIDSRVMNAIYGQGSIPLISWVPACWGCKSSAGYTLGNIVAGRFDSYVRSFATALMLYHRPVLLRFGHEMNLCSYSYGCQAALYVAAWRHLHDLFTAVGASNVKWVWCPNVDGGGHHTLAQYYPGDQYVDWLGLDGYNQTWKGWTSFDTIFHWSMAELNTINATDPVIIGEVGSSEATSGQATAGLSKAGWITDAYGYGIPSFPRIRAVTWFNEDKSTEEGCPCEWRIESSAAATAAFARAVAGPGYLSTWQ